MRLVYSADAITDLIRLRDFIAEHDPSAAARVAGDLIERIESLRLFPKIGRPVEAAPDPEIIREMVFGKYVIRYAAHQDVVAVLRIWHRFEKRALA